MKLKSLIAAGLTATLLGTGAVYAQATPATPAEAMVTIKNEAMAAIPEVMAMVEALKAEGYTYIEIRSTLLGRAKILAYGADSMREVVMSAATGEVMRDVMREHDGSMAAGREAMEAAKSEMEGAMEGTMGGGTGGGMGGGSTGGGMGGGSTGGGMGGGMGGS